MSGQIQRSPLPLGEPTRNIGAMFERNRARLGAKPAFAERVNGVYRHWSWEELVSDIEGVSAWLTGEQGLRPGDRVAFVSMNSYARLVCEMAVMSLGLVSVPVFVGYPKELMGGLLKFAKARLLLCDDPAWFAGGYAPDEIPKSVRSLASVLGEGRASREGPRRAATAQWREASPGTLALIMFTSGTSALPKGVQLSHGNLMSQQRALEILWKPESGMRFLCYLPWHHSFGGLFERFFALHSGGCLAIDDSWGKDADQLIRNFSEIRPHVYFSVPKIHQEVVSRVLASKEVERAIFHPELKFVFTAAAPLPISTSEIFRNKGIPVVEGWGLTETSPCCTLTEMRVEREAGVVGRPIPGVEVRLGEENEIEVRGPNVMSGYVDNPEETARVLDRDGWFKTGDVGELTSHGLKIVSRRDRMFKLSNGEKVFPSVVEEGIKGRCKFVKHAFVFGRGLPNPMLMVFPNMEMFKARPDGSLDRSDCKYPGGLQALSGCLAHCLQELNDRMDVRAGKVRRAVIVARELTIENHELTPSFKVIPRKVEERYQEVIRPLEDGKLEDLPKDTWVVDLKTG